MCGGGEEKRGGLIPVSPSTVSAGSSSCNRTAAGRLDSAAARISGPTAQQIATIGGDVCSGAVLKASLKALAWMRSSLLIPNRRGPTSNMNWSVKHIVDQRVVAQIPVARVVGAVYVRVCVKGKCVWVGGGRGV